MRAVVPGYRWFHCESCDHLWDEWCRDYQTPSISDCPLCHETWMPYGGRPARFSEERLASFDEYKER